ncbi:MAG: SEC-C domain-containing protein [Muribaculaceae bacterium]|nr:SEC-C domain-containing protein [Muribaculaceae bacterium]
MKKTSLLLSNYPRISERGLFKSDVYGDSIECVIGYDIADKIDKKRLKHQMANDLMLGILSYDEVLIGGSNIWYIIQILGVEFTKLLLRERIIRIINDTCLNAALMKVNDKWQVDFLSNPTGKSKMSSNKASEFDTDSLDYIEYGLYRHNFKGSEAESLLILIEEGAKKIVNKKIMEIATNETNRDIKSQQYFDNFKVDNGRVYSSSTSERLIRLQELNKTCAIASDLNVDSIRCDAEIRRLLSFKTNILSKRFSYGIYSLNQVLYEKKLPELGSLFVNEVISSNDILKLRDNYNGKLFRYWMNQDSYEESELRADIMNTTTNVLGKNISQLIRLVSCNLLGCFGFVPGIAASALDSFILNKMASGWHPNFFLDDLVKTTIDESISHHENIEKREKYSKLFHGVNRNENCPCGSGLKFKKCHGKLI